MIPAVRGISQSFAGLSQQEPHEQAERQLQKQQRLGFGAGKGAGSRETL